MNSFTEVSSTYNNTTASNPKNHVNESIQFRPSPSQNIHQKFINWFRRPVVLDFQELQNCIIYYDKKRASDFFKTIPQLQLTEKMSE